MKIKKIVLLGLLVLNCIVVLQTASGYLIYINQWPSIYRNPLYYYPENVWSQWATAVSGWNSKNPAGGPMAADTNPNGNQPIVVFPVNQPSVSWKAKTTLTAGPDYTWAYATTQLNNGKSFVTGEKRCICLHEIGHLWSLRDVTTGNSVMDIPWLSSQSYSITIPQQDDLNGVDAVY